MLSCSVASGVESSNGFGNTKGEVQKWNAEKGVWENSDTKLSDIFEEKELKLDQNPQIIDFPPIPLPKNTLKKLKAKAVFKVLPNGTAGEISFEVLNMPEHKELLINHLKTVKFKPAKYKGQIIPVRMSLWMVKQP